MATGTTLVSVEEYLASTHKPAYEYLEGVLREKPIPTYDHSNLELQLCDLINGLDCGFRAVPELTVRISRSRFLVPDVGVQLVSELQRPYPVKPIHLCIEVLSPEDRLADIVVKCGDYHRWGTQCCWIVDPETRNCGSITPAEGPTPFPKGAGFPLERFRSK